MIGISRESEARDEGLEGFVRSGRVGICWVMFWVRRVLANEGFETR